MKKLKLLFRFIFITLILYLILGLISFAIAYFFKFTLKDTSFCIGLLVFIGKICLSISGNPTGLSLQSLGNQNSQYVSYVDLIARQHEEKTDKAEVIINVLISSSLWFSSILILITSYCI
jgi:hypothetical protein